jgi:photosystem II stability/assembly factor-like uncharacterized protein
MKKLFIYIILLLFINETFGQWQSTNGPSIGRINSLTSIGSEIFALTQYFGVYHSTNNGSSWSPVNNGLGDQQFYGSIISDGSNLFVNGFHISSNHGANWTTAANGLPNLFDISTAAVSGNNLYAGTGGGVVYITTNNGGNWTPVNNNMTGAPYGSIVSLSASGNNLFVGTSTGGILVSKDNGATLTSVSSIGGGTKSVLLSNANKVLISSNYSLYVTSDTGKTTSLLYTFPSVVSSLTTIGTSIIFVGTETSGIYISVDGGTTWNPANNGLHYPSTQVTSVYAIGTDVYAGTCEGLFKSYDNGNNWNPVNSGLPYASAGGNYSCMAAVGSLVYLPTLWNYGISVSTDNGASWQTKSNVILGVISIAADSTVVLAGASSGLYSSTDTGSNWTKYPITNNNEITSVTINKRTIFAGTTIGKSFLSTDKGASWQTISLPTSAPLYAVAVRGDTLFAGDDSSKIYRSVDNGVNWKVVKTGATDYKYVSKIISKGNCVYAAIANDGAYASYDGGTNWKAINSGFVLNNGYNNSSAITTITMIGNNLYAGTDGYGAYMSKDSGATWTVINNGFIGVYPSFPPPAELYYPSIYAMVSNNTSLFAATSDGVWKSFCCPVLAVHASKDTVCKGSPTVLTISGAYSYKWSDSQTGSAITVNPFVKTTYTVIGESGSGFSATAQITIKVKALPTVSVSATSASICSGQSIHLCAKGGAQYTWNNILASSCQTYTPLTNTTYTIIGSAINGCTDTAYSNVKVNSNPVVTALSDTICFGQVAKLCANGASHYNWLNQTGDTCISVSPASLKTYTVVGTDLNGCKDTAYSTVKVNPLPIITVNSATICFGQSVNICAHGTSNYMWINQTTDTCIYVSPTISTTYTVLGTNSNNCVNTALSSVIVNPKPAKPIISITNDSLFSTVTKGNEWYESTVGIITDKTGSAIHLTQSGVYFVIVKDSNACFSDTSNIINFKEPQLFLIYPNPTNGKITIETPPSDGAGLIIYDLLGQKLSETAIIDTYTQIDISTFAPAAYLFELVNGNKSEVKRIIKK